MILDSDINPILLSSFVGALGLFGKDNLGKIEEISVKGLDVQMIIVYKYNLIIIAILDKSFVGKDIRAQVEIALDMFYTTYLDVNESKRCIETSQFTDFKKILIIQINKSFGDKSNLQDDDDTGEFGFFTQAIKKMREGERKNGNGNGI